MTNSEYLYENFKDFGVKKEVAQVVADNMQGCTLREMGEVLYILRQFDFQTRYIDEMMEKGIPIDMIQKLLPYLEHTEQVDVRKERLGEEADYLNTFTKRIYPAIKERIEDLRKKLPNCNGVIFLQDYSYIKGQLEFLATYGEIYDKTGSVKKNTEAYEKDIEYMYETIYRRKMADKKKLEGES